MWKKTLGWLLLSGGIICGIWLLAEPLPHIFYAIAGVLEAIDSIKGWGLIGVAILI